MQADRFLKPFLTPAVAMVAVLALATFCVGQEASSEGPGIQDDSSSDQAGIHFFLDLAQSKKLQGIVVDIQKFDITTGFGDVQVPLDKIEGIRLNAMPDGSAVMAFKNGDILTGILHVNDLKIRTSWGFATVNIAYIQQISTTRGAVFSSSAADGKTTWQFTPGNR